MEKNHLFPSIRFKEFTNAWYQEKIEEIYSFASEGGTPATNNLNYYNNGNIPFVKIEDTIDKYIYKTESYINEIGLKNSSAWLVPKNNIILTNGATIGNVAINKIPLTTKQGILALIIKNGYNVEYIYYLLKNKYFQKELNKNSSIGTFANITLQNISKINITKNSKEQKLISNLFILFDNLISIWKMKLSNLENLKNLFLNKMFV
ncbi:restriction endonuclease subunit S [Mycoplasma miroungirhinis]|uniref:Type I restriction modification DNA specificity domain-containing protein n=1 Tax=Mycoplasma miroungirhinis TaxID=754516 RepID=A0A6M4JCX1_9MOLU|nr:restriction endonuclease subunit S [Mycoplasma miroungirhinis]QJR43876.1 hypothetical protein HLA92_00130 [Mycoplasma miroungirhinis]